MRVQSRECRAPSLLPAPCLFSPHLADMCLLQPMCRFCTPTPRQAAAPRPRHRLGSVHTGRSSAFRRMDWGGEVLFRSGMGSELVYHGCRILGSWIKALNHVVVGRAGGHRLWCNIPLACRLLALWRLLTPGGQAQMKESQSWTLPSAEPRQEAQGQGSPMSPDQSGQEWGMRQGQLNSS